MGPRALIFLGHVQLSGILQSDHMLVSAIETVVSSRLESVDLRAVLACPMFLR
jgi:hypothetical protein